MRGCSGGEHAWLLPAGCVVAPGGMHGCSGGVHVWLLPGVCMVPLGRHAWFLWGACMVPLGGMHGCSQGGMHGCSQGGWCMGYDEIWEIQSMSRWYASYWNAFLLIVFSIFTACNEVGARQYFQKCVSRISVHGGACMEGRHVWQGGACMGGWVWQGGMHGGGMRGRYYEIRSVSGRYASYWNAFLF